MGKNILVIDDEEILTKTFARLLKTKGYGVAIAASGEAAVELTGQDDFDLILSDIRMPGIDGVEAARQIQKQRKDKGKSVIPIIFLTGFADKALEAQAQELGPVAYIYKPFDAFKLLDTIERALK